MGVWLDAVVDYPRPELFHSTPGYTNLSEK